MRPNARKMVLKLETKHENEFIAQSQCGSQKNTFM